MAKEKKVQVTMEKREERKEEKKTTKAATAKKTTKATTAKLDAKLAEKQEKQEKEKPEIQLTEEQKAIAKDLIKGEFGEKALLRARTPAMTQKGKPFTLTKEGILEKMTAPINKAYIWHFTTLGYHTSGGKKVSHFEKVTGRKWAEVEAKNLTSQNKLVSISLGSRGKHFLFLVPASGEAIKVKTLIGPYRDITRENCLHDGNYLLFSNHGRSYRVGQFLAFQYNLHYIAIPRGTYSYSNDSNFQFDALDDDGKEWILLSRRGNAINLGDLHPLDLIQDLADGGDRLIRLIDNKPIS